MGRGRPGGKDGEPGSRGTSALRLGALLPAAVKSRLDQRIRNVASETRPSFQELAFLPYKPGEGYAVPPLAKPEPEPDRPASELPVPPERLWLGYDYPAAGSDNVRTMLDIVGASGFALAQGDRILDLGCGAGRMIRHLVDLAENCEIWGADISAEHILWCRHNLSPPFNFVAVTKVPHLPFEDRSFRLVYCGSLFTHIDDLAAAWLLELHRILAPGGRLYVTIHDRHTVELYEKPSYDVAPVVRKIKSSALYQKSKASFGMMTVGRDNRSQVFYDVDYFAAMARPMFELLSVTQEAYYSQTAVLLGRKA